LHAIGLPELVTSSLAEYEALALRLAREPDTLASLRAKLAANRRTHPLFDMARYTQDFEALLLRTWDERHRL
jgi:predicted O-linked N-acetylglucosamine transferase (SPINDLY family)